MEIGGSYQRRPRESGDSGLAARRSGATLMSGLMRRCHDGARTSQFYFNCGRQPVRGRMAVSFFSMRFVSDFSNLSSTVLLESYLSV